MRVYQSVLWGVIGGLSFLVLLQGYELLEGVRVSLGVKFGVAVLITVFVSGLVGLLRQRGVLNGRA